MEELELSVADRVRTGRELLELADQGQQTKGVRMRAREEEKLRVDRENWIINILKSGKVLTPDKKRQYFKSSLNIMKWFAIGLPDEAPAADGELFQDFTEQFINLYADFFQGLDGQFEFKLSVRQIIRPNNRSVVVDLVRYLVNFTRDYFKQVALQSQHCDSAGRARHLPTVQSMPIVSSVNMIAAKHNATQIEKAEQSSILYEKERSPPAQTLPRSHTRPKRRLQTHEILNIEDPYGIYKSSAIQKTQPTQMSEKQKQSLAINLFFKLKERNAKIAYQIECWRVSIFGDQKSIQYNFHNLYTKKELQEIENRHIQAPKKLLVGDHKETDLKNFVKEYIAYETQKQKKLKPQPRIHDRYEHTIVLHYDHRYPLELVISGNKVQANKEENCEPTKLHALNNRNAVSYDHIKRRELLKKEMLENPSQKEDYSQTKLIRKKNIPTDLAESCIVERSKVLKIRKEGLLPELNTKSPSKQQLDLLNSSRRQNSYGDYVRQLEPYTSRSTRAAKFEQEAKKQFNFRNVRAFTRSKNLDTLNSGAIELLRLMRQHTQVS